MRADRSIRRPTRCAGLDAKSCGHILVDVDAKTPSQTGGMLIMDRRQRALLTRAYGGPPGARTQNLRIKSPQLYQLS
jgi:hypothetical protein